MPWIDDSSIHWIVCEIGTVRFGFSHVCISLTVVSYLFDSNTLYAASALAANVLIQLSLAAPCGSHFPSPNLKNLLTTTDVCSPMFKTPMYHNLGIHWASSISTFLAVACLPFPWIFYKLGSSVRRHWQYAAESATKLEAMDQRAAHPRSGCSNMKSS